MDEARPNSLGKYEVRSTLGRGAMGTVYEGWDPAIARRVAIKTVRIPDAGDTEAQEELARFRREAQAAGRLNHPNIVGVFDYGETADLAYIVMEFVDGRTLKSVLDNQERFNLPDMMRVMQDVLGGLGYSHERGVVHRDIKPANIILASDRQAKIADFGIARIESSNMTQAGTVLGTPAYMSPEQFMGQVVTARSDLYSIGVVLYQMLTGERPFEGSLTSIMHKVLHTQPPKPSDLAVTVPPGMDAVVERAMARRPEDRFTSAAEFAQALRDAAEAGPASATVEAPTGDATVVAVPPRAAAPMQAAAAAPPARASHLPIAAVAGVALVAILSGGAWFVLFQGRPHQAALPAQQRVSLSTKPQEAAPAPASIATESAQALSLPAERTATSQPPPTVKAPTFPAQVAAPASVPPTPLSADSVPGAVAPPAPAVPAPATAPVPTPAPAPAQQLAMVRSPAVLRTAIAAATMHVPCALVSGNLVELGGTIVVSGLVGRGAPRARLQDAVAEAAPGGTVDWRVATFDNPVFCQALDSIQTVAASRFGGTPSGFSVALDGARTQLREGDALIVRVVMPDFEAQLQVDYLQSDGTVVHIQRPTAYPARPFPPRASVSIGDPKPGGPIPFAVSEPYGTDMVIAIASARPLFARGQPETEPIATYLKALSSALAAAQERHERVVASALTLVTAPRR